MMVVMTSSTFHLDLQRAWQERVGRPPAAIAASSEHGQCSHAGVDLRATTRCAIAPR